MLNCRAGVIIGLYSEILSVYHVCRRMMIFCIYEILHQAVYVGLQVYYLSINELKSLTNLEKYFMSLSRRPRLVAALLFL